MEITFDCYSEACSETPFKAQMNAVPRKGEHVRIHKSLLPSYYHDRAEFFNDGAYDDSGEDWMEMIVIGVNHFLRKSGHQIEVDFDYE